MRLIKFKCVGFVFLALTGCFGAINYTSTANTQQDFSIEAIDKVVIVCHCPRYTVQRTSESDTISLQIFGQYSIRGYHGTQSAAGQSSLKKKAIEFRGQVRDRSLLLESKELVIMHHSVILTEVQIEAPDGIEIMVTQVSRNQLQDMGYSNTSYK